MYFQVRHLFSKPIGGVENIFILKMPNMLYLCL